jgi:LuxR family maltose regulon positive regulatory protein
MEQLKDAVEESVFLHPIDQYGAPSIPPSPPVSRPALVRRINEAMSGRLVLVTAPAGWGKTSLLAEWANQTDYRIAWVSGEGTRGDTRRFFLAFVNALEQVCAGVGGDIYPMLRSARPMATGQVLTMIEEALSSLPRPTAVVVDDFHLIDDPDLIDGIWHLAVSGPPQVRFVISAREAPSWPIARRRVYGDVTEIGVQDLAFTDEETIELLGADCDDEPLARLLQRRAEGWVAGLRLVKLWLRTMGNLPAVEASFQGSHRDIADYLAEEVMKHVPPEVERFLMHTAVLDRFCGPLAAAVTGIDDAGSVLDQVEQQGLFIIPLDHERRWYRYHGIFRQFHVSRLERTHPDAERNVWRSAARWYREADQPIEAATAYLRGGEPAEAAELLERFAEPLLLRDGETTTLIHLVEQLPRGLLAGRPALVCYYAWALVLVGRLDEAEAMARDIEARIGASIPEHDRPWRSEVASIRARLAAYRGNHEETIAFSKVALECSDPSFDWFRADALLSLGFAYRAIGKTREACDAFGRASRLGWESGFTHAALWGSRYQALTLVSLGRLRDAALMIERDMERAVTSGMDRSPAYAALLVTRGEIHYERDEREAARSDLMKALQLARSVGDAKILMNVYVAIAILEDAEGNLPAARDAIRRAVGVFDGPGEKAVEAWIALRHGEVSTVRQWMQDYVREHGESPSLGQGEQEQVMLGRAMLALGDTDEGTAFLRALLSESDESGRHGRAMVIKILLACAANEAGNEDEAAALARDVVDLAMREGFVRTILDEGQDFLRLLRRTMRRETSPAHRQFLASLFADAEAAGGESDGAPNGALIEPLTPRQEEVLRLMVEGRSNREIADDLYLSEGTIKAHIHQIFGKLMVRNRAEAIRVARELDLAG